MPGGRVFEITADIEKEGERDAVKENEKKSSFQK